MILMIASACFYISYDVQHGLYSNLSMVFYSTLSILHVLIVFVLSAVELLIQSIWPDWDVWSIPLETTNQVPSYSGNTTSKVHLVQYLYAWVWHAAPWPLAHPWFLPMFILVISLVWFCIRFLINGVSAKGPYKRFISKFIIGVLLVEFAGLFVFNGSEPVFNIWYPVFYTTNVLFISILVFYLYYIRPLPLEYLRLPQGDLVTANISSMTFLIITCAGSTFFNILTAVLRKESPELESITQINFGIVVAVLATLLSVVYVWQCNFHTQFGRAKYIWYFALFLVLCLWFPYSTSFSNSWIAEYRYIPVAEDYHGLIITVVGLTTLVVMNVAIFLVAYINSSNPFSAYLGLMDRYLRSGFYRPAWSADLTWIPASVLQQLEFPSNCLPIIILPYPDTQYYRLVLIGTHDNFVIYSTMLVGPYINPHLFNSTYTYQNYEYILHPDINLPIDSPFRDHLNTTVCTNSPEFHDLVAQLENNFVLPRPVRSIPAKNWSR